jgi:hypothetical protein
MCGGEAASSIDQQHNFPEALIRLDSLMGRAHFFHREDLVDDWPHRSALE